MPSKTATVAEYLASLPPDRRAVVSAIRDVIRANLDRDYEEGMQYGMIHWYVPLSRFPKTYNGQPLCIAGLASQKGYMTLYLLGVYGDPELSAWFRTAFAKAGKQLDMGKSCVRFRSLDALPLEVIGETIRRVPVERFLAQYQDARAGSKRAKPPAKTAAAGKAPAKQQAAKRQPAKKQHAKQRPAARAPAGKRAGSKR